MTTVLYLLHECAAGLLLLRVKEWDGIGEDNKKIESACGDINVFKQLISLSAFYPFADAKEALDTQLAVASGSLSNAIINFLQLHIPLSAGSYAGSKTSNSSSSNAGDSSVNADASASASRSKGKGKIKSASILCESSACSIGVCDACMAKRLTEVGYRVLYNRSLVDVYRCIRMHMGHIMKQMDNRISLKQFEVGLAHSYSREVMHVDPRMQDKPIIQSIALIDSLDKSINLFCMRLKEWYGAHLPELMKIVTDAETFAKVVLIVKRKEYFDFKMKEEQLHASNACKQASEGELLEAVGRNEEIAAEIVNAIKHSMGHEVSAEDFANMEAFAKQVIRMCEQRRSLQEYLGSKMDIVSPNLKTVVGDNLAARLISHAGALVSLAKYPASTIQILGAEKALFRALKSRSGRTPKYGLLFHSSFIGRVQQQKHRGRMSRYLASKCALAARIDAFGEDIGNTQDGFVRSHIYGDKLKEQLEERLRYLSDGIVPRKNVDVMREAAAEVELERKAKAKALKKANKKKAKEAAAAAAADGDAEGDAAGGYGYAAADAAEDAAADAAVEDDESSRKKKKKKRVVEEELCESENVSISKKKKKQQQLDA